ncbi:increased DNA methylation 1-like [Hevea brasiliensis]|uniref:increased DNA methylation 1-like n=1 Tax=Hevea brasiliensis TaxID=3981 RepID=UPI0025CD1F48|nr:increased DNA methylation 1-like [Hevea brasiliensis]
MAYELRERKQKDIINLSFDSEGENESDSISDPDYITTRLQRNRNSCRLVQNMDVETKFPGVDGISIGRKRRGCLPWKRANNGNGELKEKKRKIVLGLCASVRQTKPEEKTILSWLIKHGEIYENDRVQYTVNKLPREGIARRDGVWCKCCNKLMTVWEFEIHAGSNLKMPYANINVIRTCSSLLKHQIHLWNEKKKPAHRNFNHVGPIPGATDSNDDACQICADGGELICCEKCPSTFHPSCLEMERIPQGDWLCSYCVCIFCDGGNGDMLTCQQCEKKYHWECFLQREELDLNKNWLTLFCGTNCQQLQRLLGVRHEIKKGFSWTLIRRLDPFDIDINEHTRMECNSKATLALEVLNECFVTNTDWHTRINILQSVVYNRGSNLSRMNFKGFYTLILEKNDAIVSAATIRMHGNDLAEMPFIGTRERYRFKGLSRMLFDALGYVFSCIEAKDMIIPSLPELANMWQEKYGFRPIDDVVKPKLINYNTLMFPCTVRLQKTFPDISASSSRAMDIGANDEKSLKLALLDLNLDPPEPADDELAKPVAWNE